jgi:hypothetical protein
MATVAKPSDPTSGEMADLEEICRLVSAGKRVTDPALRQRVQERGDSIRREMLARHGITNIAVDLIREARDEG